MFLEGWADERFILQTLRRVSKQRVAVVLQPGNVWVVERAVPDEGRATEALRTCHIRGWIEPIENAVPHGALTSDGKLPKKDVFTHTAPVYRLTDSGWNAIRRTHQWVIFTCVVSALTLAATIVGILLTLPRS